MSHLGSHFRTAPELVHIFKKKMSIRHLGSIYHPYIPLGISENWVPGIGQNFQKRDPLGTPVGAGFHTFPRDTFLKKWSLCVRIFVPSTEVINISKKKICPTVSRFYICPQTGQNLDEWAHRDQQSWLKCVLYVSKFFTFFETDDNFLKDPIDRLGLFHCMFPRN